MRLKIVGSAAGGGFPQWNCNYYLSRAARSGASNCKPRSQSSLAACANGQDWILFNASPDIRTQMANNIELHPLAEGPLRNSPIAAVVLTNADVDHIAGLLSLREKQPFVVYATERVLNVLNENSIFNVLDPLLVKRRQLSLNTRTLLRDTNETSLGIEIETFAVPGKIALFLEDAGKEADGFGTQLGDTVGVQIRDLETGNSAFYIPGCAAIDAQLSAKLLSAQLLMFDGTVFTDNEMPNAGVGSKTGQRMGHIAISGDGGSIEALKALNISRKIYLHINNTNPILDEASVEHAFVRQNGWEVAYDGMEVSI